MVGSLENMQGRFYMLDLYCVEADNGEQPDSRSRRVIDSVLAQPGCQQPVREVQDVQQHGKGARSICVDYVGIR